VNRRNGCRTFLRASRCALTADGFAEVRDDNVLSLTNITTNTHRPARFFSRRIFVIFYSRVCIVNACVRVCSHRARHDDKDVIVTGGQTKIFSDIVITRLTRPLLPFAGTVSRRRQFRSTSSISGPVRSTRYGTIRHGFHRRFVFERP